MAQKYVRATHIKLVRNEDAAISKANAIRLDEVTDIEGALKGSFTQGSTLHECAQCQGKACKGHLIYCGMGGRRFMSPLFDNFRRLAAKSCPVHKTLDGACSCPRPKYTYKPPGDQGVVVHLPGVVKGLEKDKKGNKKDVDVTKMWKENFGSNESLAPFVKFHKQGSTETACITPGGIVPWILAHDDMQGDAPIYDLRSMTCCKIACPPCRKRASYRTGLGDVKVMEQLATLVAKMKKKRKKTPSAGVLASFKRIKNLTWGSSRPSENLSEDEDALDDQPNADIDARDDDLPAAPVAPPSLKRSSAMLASPTTFVENLSSSFHKSNARFSASARLVAINGGEACIEGFGEPPLVVSKEIAAQVCVDCSVDFANPQMEVVEAIEKGPCEWPGAHYLVSRLGYTIHLSKDVCSQIAKSGTREFLKEHEVVCVGRHARSKDRVILKRSPVNGMQSSIYMVVKVSGERGASVKIHPMYLDLIDGDYDGDQVEIICVNDIQGRFGMDRFTPSNLFFYKSGKGAFEVQLTAREGMGRLEQLRGEGISVTLGRAAAYSVMSRVPCFSEHLVDPGKNEFTLDEIITFFIRSTRLQTAPPTLLDAKSGVPILLNGCFESWRDGRRVPFPTSGDASIPKRLHALHGSEHALNVQHNLTVLGAAVVAEIAPVFFDVYSILADPRLDYVLRCCARIVQTRMVRQAPGQTLVDFRQDVRDVQLELLDALHLCIIKGCKNPSKIVDICERLVKPFVKLPESLGQMVKSIEHETLVPFCHIPKGGRVVGDARVPRDGMLSDLLFGKATLAAAAVAIGPPRGEVTADPRPLGTVELDEVAFVDPCGRLSTKLDLTPFFLMVIHATSGIEPKTGTTQVGEARSVLSKLNFLVSETPHGHTMGDLVRDFSSFCAFCLEPRRWIEREERCPRCAKRWDRAVEATVECDAGKKDTPGILYHTRRDLVVCVACEKETSAKSQICEKCCEPHGGDFMRKLLLVRGEKHGLSRLQSSAKLRIEGVAWSARSAASGAALTRPRAHERRERESLSLFGLHSNKRIDESVVGPIKKVLGLVDKSNARDKKSKKLMRCAWSLYTENANEDYYKPSRLDLVALSGRRICPLGAFIIKAEAIIKGDYTVKYFLENPPEESIIYERLTTTRCDVGSRAETKNCERCMKSTLHRLDAYKLPRISQLWATCQKCRERWPCEDDSSAGCIYSNCGGATFQTKMMVPDTRIDWICEACCATGPLPSHKDLNRPLYSNMAISSWEATAWTDWDFMNGDMTILRIEYDADDLLAIGTHPGNVSVFLAKMSAYTSLAFWVCSWNDPSLCRRTPCVVVHAFLPWRNIEHIPNLDVTIGLPGVVISTSAEGTFAQCERSRTTRLTDAKLPELPIKKVHSDWKLVKSLHGIEEAKRARSVDDRSCATEVAAALYFSGTIVSPRAPTEPNFLNNFGALKGRVARSLQIQAMREVQSLLYDADESNAVGQLPVCGPEAVLLLDLEEFRNPQGLACTFFNYRELPKLDLSTSDTKKKGLRGTVPFLTLNEETRVLTVHAMRLMYRGTSDVEKRARQDLLDGNIRVAVIRELGMSKGISITGEYAVCPVSELELIRHR